MTNTVPENNATLLALLDQAKALAIQKHDGQTDKLNVPYIHHIEDVARRVAHLGPDVEIVAWLHDIVEDTDVTLDQLECRFGPSVRASVDAMTRRLGQSYFDDYLPRLQTDAAAVAVKIADASHNWGKAHLLRATEPKRARYFEEKYKAVLERLGADLTTLPETLVFENTGWKPA